LSTTDAEAAHAAKAQAWTLVRLADGAAETFGHAQLDALFYEYEVQGRNPGSANANKIKRSVALVRGIEEDRVFESEAILLELANRVLANPYQRQNLTALVASLGVDGLEWAGDQLVPSDPGAAPLAPELTALEQELNQLGLNVAATHYRQAVDNCADGNFEACNGQLRSFLEDLIKGAAQRRGQQQEAGPDAALQHLRNAGVLDSEEWAIFRALWHGTQDNGPHAGLTDAEEARFRMHSATAAGRVVGHPGRAHGARVSDAAGARFEC
jgi:hypothetical protein